MIAAYVIGAVSLVTWIGTAAVAAEPPEAQVAAEPSGENSLKAAVSRAEALERNPDRKQAIEAWVKISREYPQSAVGRVRLEMLVERLRMEGKRVTEPDFAALIPSLTEAAELDVLAAMMVLAERLRARDPATAFKWYSAAAEKGNSDAMTQLGLMHSNGSGTERDLAKAVLCLQKATDKNHPAAKVALAECYLSGKGVEKDEAKAIGILKEMVDGGDPRAMDRLGVCYQRGQGVKMDYVQAVRLFSRATEAGYGDAAGNLGVMYMNGQGVDRNSATAFNLFQRGANLGSSVCMYLLGRCYESGQGVEADPLQAAAWYGSAAAGGHAQALQALRKQQVENKPECR